MRTSWLSVALFALQGAALGAVLAVGGHFAVILGTANIRTVIPGRVYRAAQPSDKTLAYLARQHGVRTVLNLRGCAPHLGWYQAEARNTVAFDLDQEDIVFSASRMPSPVSIRNLIVAFDRATYPVVLHCHQGVDRTGLAAAVALLLMTDTPLDQARRQMSLEMGHVPLGRTRHISRFFDAYERWLADLGLSHSPAVFRVWATRHYYAGEARGDWQLVGPGTDVPAYAATVLHLRATNRSQATWHFHPGKNVGVHGYWYLDDARGVRIGTGGMGFFRADVEPGQSIDLRASLPALPPGRYSLTVELFDEPHASFTQLGDDPLVLDLLVS
jgi:hypothetical protein